MSYTHTHTLIVKININTQLCQTRIILILSNDVVIYSRSLIIVANIM